MESQEVCILIPVFNDWETLAMLLGQIEECLQKASLSQRFRVLIVDDGSQQKCDLQSFSRFKGRAIASISVLELGRNLGNQRAIAVSLSYLTQSNFNGSVLIMDGDGEDPPEYIQELVRRHFVDVKRTAVFAKRKKRSEALPFRAFYQAYRGIHWLLTGKSISMGNYSILTLRDAQELTYYPELWSHYPATFIRSRIPWNTIEIIRGKRIGGQSKMNFTSLFMHALSGISVHLDVAGIRLIVTSLFLILGATLGALFLVGVRIFTDLSIPGWTSTLFISLVGIIIQATLGSILLAFFVLYGKNMTALLTPAKNFQQFVLRMVEVQG